MSTKPLLQRVLVECLWGGLAHVVSLVALEGQNDERDNMEELQRPTLCGQAEGINTNSNPLSYMLAEVGTALRRPFLCIYCVSLTLSWQDIYFCFVFSNLETKHKLTGWLSSIDRARNVKFWSSGCQWGPRTGTLTCPWQTPQSVWSSGVVLLNLRPTQQSYLCFHLCNLPPKLFSKCTLV